jgi:hypothetical protein
MPVRTITPKPVSFNPDTCTRVDINVPCTIQSVNITTIIQTLQNQVAALTTRVAELERKTAALP